MSVSPNIVIKKCTQAGIDFWLASKVALKIGDNLPASERGVNRLIYQTLKELDPEAAEVFNVYHGIRVRTTDNSIEYFDRSRITKSLVKETRLPVSVSEDIAAKVEAEIRRLHLRDISAPLIREMVNVELLNRRLFNAKSKYARLGLPVYDVSQVLKKPPKMPAGLTAVFGNGIMEEYALTMLLPKECSEAHLNALIHVHGLSHFALTPLTFLNDLHPFLAQGIRIPGLISTGPAKKAEVAVSHAARILSISKDYVAFGTGIDSLNVLIAPFLRGIPKKRWPQIAQDFLYELNEHHLPRKAFTLTMSKKVPGWLAKRRAVLPGGKRDGAYADYADEAAGFYEIFLEVFKRGDYDHNRFRFPFLCLKEDNRGHVRLDSSKSFVYSDIVEKPGTGLMQSVSLNIPRIIHEAGGSEDKMYNEIKKKTLTAFKVFRVKHELMLENAYKKNFLPFLTQSFRGKEYAGLKDFYYLLSPDFLSCGVSKLDEGKGSIELCERIVRYLERLVKDERKETGLNIRLGYRETEFLRHRNQAEGIPTGTVDTKTVLSLQKLFPLGLGAKEHIPGIKLSGDLF